MTCSVFSQRPKAAVAALPFAASRQALLIRRQLDPAARERAHGGEGGRWRGEGVALVSDETSIKGRYSKGGDCEISETLMGGISGSNSIKLVEVNKAEKETTAKKDKITSDPPDTES